MPDGGAQRRGRRGGAAVAAGGPRPGPRLHPEPFGEEGTDGGEGDALLLAAVAVADGDGLVFQGVAVDGKAEGAAGLIHAGVALADGLLGVGLDEALLREAGGELVV